MCDCMNCPAEIPLNFYFLLLIAGLIGIYIAMISDCYRAGKAWKTRWLKANGGERQAVRSVIGPTDQKATDPPCGLAREKESRGREVLCS
jgi:hypothetical protein